MRLADVYLMAAEAVNEIDGPAQAWQYMKPVLDRALPAAKVTALQSQYTASKSAFFNGVVDQRKFELAGEMLRKADLIRWNLLKSKLDEAKADMLALSNREGKYADIPKNLYFTYESDGETLKVYGLNHGETDEQGEKLINEEGYEKKSWSTELTGYAASIYTAADPNKRQYWPIWQTFIDNSNNMLNNDWLN
jgi:hypothetical protein